MTSIEWLFNELWETPKDKFAWCFILNKAKEMHKQEMEISDEEIFNEADKKYDGIWDCEKFEEGAKWYREQLKSK
jgi:hypothetical protein